MTDAVDRSYCEIFTGKGEQSILKLKSYAEASDPLAIKLIAFLHQSNGYRDDFKDFNRHEPWELYRYIYWQWRYFNAYMDNNSTEWFELKRQEKLDVGLIFFLIILIIKQLLSLIWFILWKIPFYF